MKYGLSISLSALVLVAACASAPQTIPITDDTALRNANNQLAVVVEEGPPFMTWDSAGSKIAMGFGAIGGAISAGLAIDKGKDAVEAYNIQSPAHKIEELVLAAVAEKYGLAVSSDNIVNPLKDAPRKLEKLSTKPDIVYIDAGASLSAGGGNVNLGGIVQLVDGATKTVLGKQVCALSAFGPDEEKPKEDDLRSNNGELLKAKIDEMAERCAALFIENVLDTAPALPEVVETVAEITVEAEDTAPDVRKVSADVDSEDTVEQIRADALETTDGVEDTIKSAVEETAEGLVEDVPVDSTKDVVEDLVEDVAESVDS